MTFTNGQRVIDPGDPMHRIWLIDIGFRRFVDNPVNVNLFIDMIGVISDTSINTVPVGLPVPTSASLQNGAGTNVVFLVESQRCRRTIISGTVFARWRFNPAK